MALHMLEFDHFENEETFVLPLVREGFREQQQLEMVDRPSSTATRTIPDGSSIGWRSSYLPHSVNCC